MPIAGLGLHLLVALYFAIHAMRTGQQIYWLFVLFSFPLLGSIVYLFAIYLPGSRLQSHGNRVLRAVTRFGTFEVRAQYVLWAVEASQVARAQQLYAEIEQLRKHWPRHARQLNRPMLQQLRTAMNTIKET